MHVMEQRSLLVFYWSRSKSSLGGRIAALMLSCILSQRLLELFMAKLQGRDMGKSAMMGVRRILHEL